MLGAQNYSQAQDKILETGYINFGWVNWNEIPKGSNVQVKSESNRMIELGSLTHYKIVGPVYFGAGLQYSNINIHTNYLKYEFDGTTGQLNSAFDLNSNPFILRSAYFNNGASVYRKNKLSLNFIEIPLELMLKLKNFNVNVGGAFGLCFDAKNKLKTDDATYKTKDFDNINRTRAGVYAKVGYKYVSLYARYDLTNTFVKSKNEAAIVGDYNTLSLGLSFGFSSGDVTSRD